MAAAGRREGRIGAWRVRAGACGAGAGRAGSGWPGVRLRVEGWERGRVFTGVSLFLFFSLWQVGYNRAEGGLRGVGVRERSLGVWEAGSLGVWESGSLGAV